MPFWNDELGAYAHKQIFDSAALLLGRVTYQGFVQAWPAATDEDGFADRINTMPKFVASTTLTEVGWNASLRQGDVAEAVAQLKKQPGQDLLIYGSGELVNTFMQHGLIDEYRFWLHPVVVGSGKRLFPDATGMTTLKLSNTTTLSSGVVLLYYQPVIA